MTYSVGYAWTKGIWSRAASRSLTIAGAAAIALVPLTSAASANAKPTSPKPTFTLSSGSARFKVNGHTWLVTTADFGRSGQIEIATTNEDDLWFFDSIPASDLTANARTGDATLDTHSSFSPVAVVSMKFRPASHQKVVCEKGSETEFSGTLTGSISVTANHKGLKFKSRRVSLRSSTLIVDYGCVMPPGPAVCTPAVWTLGATVEALGNAPSWPARRSNSFFVETYRKVPAHPGARLFINVHQSEATPVFDSKKKQLTVRASGSGPITGSATITSTGIADMGTQRCVVNGKHYKESDVEYTATYASPKGHQIVGHSLVVGEVKLPSSGSGFFDIAAFKRA
jgi:hypothetical protein